MLNASSLHLSLVGSPAEQLKSIIVFIDKLIAGCYETSHILELRKHLTSLDAQTVTAQKISDLVWLEVYEALPPYLHFEKVGGDNTQLRVVPEFESILEGTRADLRYVQLIPSEKGWPEAAPLNADVPYFVRGWKSSQKIELFDGTSRSVIWTYRITPATSKAL